MENIVIMYIVSWMSAYDSSFLYFNHYWYLLLEIESITNIPNMALTHKENGAAINEEVDTTAVHDRMNVWYCT